MPGQSLRREDKAMDASVAGGDATSADCSRDAHARQSLSDAPPPSDDQQVDIEDDDSVFLTEAVREWENHFLRRLARRIHQLVCAELTGAEEALFMVFLSHDANLDGVLCGREAKSLIRQVQRTSPGALASTAEADRPVQKDGSISFVSLLRWHNIVVRSSGKKETAGFSVASVITSFMGSSALFNDARVEALDWAGLRHNIVGYRRLLLQLRQLKEEESLAPAHQAAITSGLEAAMPLYHSVLASEFEGDGAFLFELFIQVDESCNLLLEREEAVALIRRLDSNATAAELERYLLEINLAEGPLAFTGFVDWWQQACSVSNSLVAEKGAVLLATVKASSAGKSFVGFFSQPEEQRYWARAASMQKLEQLREAYCRTIEEVREYKMGRSLRLAEEESVHP